jgi:Aerobic-type carbon monoxide dehydrogenase, middle subunit CoxM/CutM homologs
MFASLSSPNIHTPQNLTEYANTITHYPQSSLWAFGSSIMDSPDFYPSSNANVEIIYLGGIDELYKFQRNDRAVEFGSMVNLNEILTSGKSVLPSVLLDTLKSIACFSVRNRISLGGVIANRRFTSALVGTLYILDCQIELRYLKRKRLHNHFFPMAKLVEKNGEILLPESSLISRVRIGISAYAYQYFKSIDDPKTNTSSSVSLAFVCNFDRLNTSSARLAFTYPDKGFFSSRDSDMLFSNLSLPLEQQAMNELITKELSLIRTDFSLTPLQADRTEKLLRNMINNLNYIALTASHE